MHFITRPIVILLKLTLCLPFTKFPLVRVVFLPLHVVFLPHMVFLSHNRRLPALLESLGVVFIKLGQSLSLKSFLFSKKTLEALSHLQDSTAPMNLSINKILQIQSPKLLSVEELFIETKPIASASVAQVHAGMYNNTKVAVKILRIGATKQIERDFKIIKIFGMFANRFVSPAFQLLDVINDIHAHLVKEVNFENEIHNITKMKSNLVLDAHLTLPTVIHRLSSQNVIVMTFLEGKSIRQITHQNHKIAYNKKAIATNIVNTYLNQTYRDGFFHADMHAGNILALPNGEISLLDLGIVSEISLKDRRAIATMIYAFLNQNHELAMRAQLKAGYITNKTFFNHNYRVAMKEISTAFSTNFDMLKFSQSLFKAMHKHGVFVPKHLLMFNKTILYIEDLTKQLDPTFEPFSIIKPWIHKWHRKQQFLIFFEELSGRFYKTKA